MSYFPRVANLLCEPTPRFEIWIGTTYCKFYVSKNAIYGGRQMCAKGYTYDWNDWQDRTSGGGFCKISDIIAKWFVGNCHAFNKAGTVTEPGYVTCEQYGIQQMLKSCGESALTEIFGYGDKVYRFKDFAEVMEKFTTYNAPRLARQAAQYK